MMAEIQAEMARQAALDAFQAKLAADKAAAASVNSCLPRSVPLAIEKELDSIQALIDAAYIRNLLV